MTKARDIASAAPAPSTVSATELGYLDGVTSAIQTQVDGKTAKSTLSTTGDIYYASSANTPARLGIGSTGNVLTVASGVPSWAAPAGGGKVLQVVYGTSNTATTVASTSYTDTGLSASITPTSASSTILVFVNQANGLSGNGSDVGLLIKLLRGSTDINTPGLQQYLYIGGTTGKEIRLNNAQVYRDSPATTSSTTYKTQGKLNDTANSMSVTFQKDNAISSLTLLEIGA